MYLLIMMNTTTDLLSRIAAARTEFLAAGDEDMADIAASALAGYEVAMLMMVDFLADQDAVKGGASHVVTVSR